MRPHFATKITSVFCTPKYICTKHFTRSLKQPDPDPSLPSGHLCLRHRYRSICLLLLSFPMSSFHSIGAQYRCIEGRKARRIRPGTISILRPRWLTKPIGFCSPSSEQSIHGGGSPRPQLHKHDLSFEVSMATRDSPVRSGRYRSNQTFYQV